MRASSACQIQNGAAAPMAAAMMPTRSSNSRRTTTNTSGMQAVPSTIENARRLTALVPNASSQKCRSVW